MRIAIVLGLLAMPVQAAEPLACTFSLECSGGGACAEHDPTHIGTCVPEGN